MLCASSPYWRVRDWRERGAVVCVTSVESFLRDGRAAFAAADAAAVAAAAFRMVAVR